MQLYDSIQNEMADRFLKRASKTRLRGLCWLTGWLTDSLTHSPSAVEVVLALAAAPGHRWWVEPEGWPAVSVNAALISVIAAGRQSTHTPEPMVDRKEHASPPPSLQLCSYDASIGAVVDWCLTAFDANWRADWVTDAWWGFQSHRDPRPTQSVLSDPITGLTLINQLISRAVRFDSVTSAESLASCQAGILDA